MRLAVVLFGVVIPLLGSLSASAGAPGPRAERGRVIFAQRCASCHGQQGEGDASGARATATAPPDLRRIAARRGGRYDSREIAAIIDGRIALAGHANREMPVWGDLDLRARPADGGAEGGRPEEIDALVAWLASIQLAD